MVFGQQRFQRIESISWTTFTLRVEDFHRIHYSGNPSIRCNRWWENFCVNQRQAGSSSCQSLTTLCGMEKEMMNFVLINSRTIALLMFVEADESTRKRLEGTQNKDHEDHIAGRGMNSLNHYNLVRKSILILKATKIPDATTAVDKESEKLQKIRAWQLTKVRNKKEVIDEARKGGKTVHFASWTDFCHLKKSEFEPLRPNCTPRWHCERWVRLLRSVYRGRIVSVTNDGTKGNGCQSMTTRMRRTSSGRNISFHPSKNGRCTQIIEKFQIEVSRHSDSSTTTQMA